MPCLRWLSISLDFNFSLRDGDSHLIMSSMHVYISVVYTKTQRAAVLRGARPIRHASFAARLLPLPAGGGTPPGPCCPASIACTATRRSLAT